MQPDGQHRNYTTLTDVTAAAEYDQTTDGLAVESLALG